MISVIICARNSDFVKKVSKSIQSTIGVPYELIIIDNSLNQKGICEVYNNAASVSRFNILCFMHEDVLMKTSDWGKIVSDILEDQTIGLVGVAGTTYKSEVPCPWWDPEPINSRIYIKQHYKGMNEAVCDIKNPYDEIISDVVLVDGVWFCCRKEVWEKNKFDSINFPGFHFYDLDFSAQVYQKYRVIVTYQILIEHFSQGTINLAWVNSSINYSRKWMNKLPFKLPNEIVDPEKIKIMKEKALSCFVFILIDNNGNIKYQVIYLFKYFILNGLSKEVRYLAKKVFNNLFRPQCH